MQLWLAPMEGLLDAALRDALTRPSGHTALPPGAASHPSGIDRCVGEFIRVTDTLLPPRAFIRTLPELLNGGRTPSGVPVRGQLLGSDPALMAENAARLAELGSHGVDLNFGCPAQVVNRHGGGAALLQEPESLYRIARAVRGSLPAHVPLSAKMRLGVDDDRRAEDCALALQDGGVGELVVHARTKAQGYRPPAHWARIADIRAVVRVPVVANGEIWSVEDALQCLAQSGSCALMLGRGMVADPGLALAIRRALATPSAQPQPAQNLQLKNASPLDPPANQALKNEAPAAAASPQPPGLGGAARRPSACSVAGTVCTAWAPERDWAQIQLLLAVFWAQVSRRVEPRHRAGRVKQWLNLLRRRHPEAQAAFDALRTAERPAEVEAYFGWASSAYPAAQPGLPCRATA